MKRWVLVLASLLTAAPGFATPPSSPRRVSVEVVGEGLPRLESSLRESLGRLALQVDVSRPRAPSSLSADATLARVWVVRGDRGVALVVQDPSTGRVIEQRQLHAETDDLLEEQLTLLIRSALETGLDLPQERASVGALPESPSPPNLESAAVVLPPSTVVEEPKRAFGALDSTRPPAWDPEKPRGNSIPSPSARPAGLVIGVEPAASVRWWSSDLAARRAVSLGVSVVHRAFVGSPGLEFGLGYYEPAVSDTETLSFDIETRESWLMGRVALFEASTWDWRVLSGPALLWSLADVRSTAPGYTVNDPRTHWDLVWRSQLSVRYWVQERLAVGLTGGLDHDSSTAAYGVDERGVERTIAREARLRPSVGLSLGTEFGVSR